MIKWLLLGTVFFGTAALADGVYFEQNQVNSSSSSSIGQPLGQNLGQNLDGQNLDIEQCTGYDTRTLALVTGTCSGNSFTGYDSRTLAFVSGSCDGQTFTAYDSRTLSYCYGNCH